MQVPGLMDSLVKYLRERIICGDIKPNERINEVQLSKKLEVSRAPIREAMRILEKESLIHNIARRGFFATPISSQDCLNLFEAREMMECFAIDLLKKKGFADYSSLESCVKQSGLLQRPDINDPSEKYFYFQKIVDFHIQLINLTDNERLIDLYGLSYPSYARYLAIYTYNFELMKEGRKGHLNIIKKMKQGKFGEAKDLLREHISFYSDIIVKKIKELRIEG